MNAIPWNEIALLSSIVVPLLIFAWTNAFRRHSSIERADRLVRRVRLRREAEALAAIDSRFRLLGSFVEKRLAQRLADRWFASILLFGVFTNAMIGYLMLNWAGGATQDIWQPWFLRKLAMRVFWIFMAAAGFWLAAVLVIITTRSDNINIWTLTGFRFLHKEQERLRRVDSLAKAAITGIGFWLVVLPFWRF